MSLIVFFTLNTFAQDIIVKKDGSTIISKVYEIGNSYVKYKKYTNQQGPIYSIDSSDIMRINYENGEIENFESIKKIHSKFMIKTGGGISSVVGKHADTNLKFSFLKGISYDIALSNNFSIIPGLEIALKGCHTEIIDETIHMWYLQMPILAALKFDISDNIKFAIKTGPYASYGLFGSTVYSYSVFDSDEGFRRFDMGAIVGVSLEIEHFMIGVEYSRGLRKLDSHFKQYNQAFDLVFGIKLGN